MRKSLDLVLLNELEDSVLEAVIDAVSKNWRSMLAYLIARVSAQDSIVAEGNGELTW